MTERRRRAEFTRRLGPLGPDLVVFARRLLGPGHDAEDALQGALAAAWKRFRTGLEVSSFPAWIYRFLTLESRNVARRRARVRRRETTLEGDSLASPRQDDDSETARLLDELAVEPFRIDPTPLLRTLDDHLSSAMTTLAEGERTALLLRAIAELECQEIARILDVPLGTVLSRLFRAREKLRTRLAGYARERRLAPSPSTPPAEPIVRGLET